ncbi:MAG: hypothetical protein WDN69_14640 [Aliidongia sp.]
MFGETETQRTERHVLMLRRFSDLALKAAERIDRQADAAEALAEAAEIEAQEAAAETPATEGVDAETPKPAAPVDRGPTAAEISLAIHRLSRVVRYDIALEEKLIRDLLAPPAAPVPAPAPQLDPQPETTRKSKWCKPPPSVILAEAKAKVESFNATALSYDERLEPEDIEDLMAELRDELESGRHDKTLLKHIEGPEKIGADFLIERGIILNLAKIMFGPTGEWSDAPGQESFKRPPDAVSAPPDAALFAPEPEPEAMPPPSGTVLGGDSSDPNGQPPAAGHDPP